jgi:hypothetical protein
MIEFPQRGAIKLETRSLNSQLFVMLNRPLTRRVRSARPIPSGSQVKLLMLSAGEAFEASSREFGRLNFAASRDTLDQIVAAWLRAPSLFAFRDGYCGHSGALTGPPASRYVNPTRITMEQLTLGLKRDQSLEVVRSMFTAYPQPDSRNCVSIHKSLLRTHSQA